MIKKCLFPVAGYGTRFLPATKAMPKEMLPIVCKPLIQYGVEEAVEAGMHEIAFVTGRHKRSIEDHFDINYELEHEIKGTDKERQLEDIRRLISTCTFSYTRQNEIKGLGHAILTGETLIGHTSFGVVLADDFCVSDDIGVLSQMAKVFEKYQCSIVGIVEIDSKETSKYGIIDGHIIDDGLIEISNMVEKPDPQDAPSNYGIIGRYILTPNIFDILRHAKPGKNGEIQLTDALFRQAQEGTVLGYRVKCKRFDCGSINGFIEATNYIYAMEHQ